MKSRAGMRGSRETTVERFDGDIFESQPDWLAVEEPLEIRLGYGPANERAVKSISVTMRTPGNDEELATGFLLTEGVVRDAADIESVRALAFEGDGSSSQRGNVVTVELAPGVEVSLANLQRNFYMTSSCGVCGKASLLALRTVCPPRRKNEFTINVETLCALPEKLRSAQGIFDQTGGLHAAALFSSDGEMDSLREDVGRHNAVDKLLGAAMLADRGPLRDRLLLLSGRASFELLQKALMGGVPMVASVGAPSSLAVQVAREFDITLIGFLRDNRFNAYHGAQRIHASAGEYAKAER
jgi:FdhD protein